MRIVKIFKRISFVDLGTIRSLRGGIEKDTAAGSDEIFQNHLLSKYVVMNAFSVASAIDRNRITALCFVFKSLLCFPFSIREINADNSGCTVCWFSTV